MSSSPTLEVRSACNSDPLRSSYKLWVSSQEVEPHMTDTVDTAAAAANIEDDAAGAGEWQIPMRQGCNGMAKPVH